MKRVKKQHVSKLYKGLKFLFVFFAVASRILKSCAFLGEAIELPGQSLRMFLHGDEFGFGLGGSVVGLFSCFFFVRSTTLGRFESFLEIGNLGLDFIISLLVVHFLALLGLVKQELGCFGGTLGLGGGGGG